MLVSEIMPIEYDSRNLSNEEDLASICEIPVLGACKIFFNLGIKTVMSSGNYYNVFWASKPRYIYSESNVPDISRNDFSYGYGYAWIMLDYDSLNSHNRELVNSLSSGESSNIIDSLNEDSRSLFFQRCAIDNVQPADNQLVQLCLVPGRDCRICSNSRRYPPNLVNAQVNAFRALKTNHRPLDKSYIDFYSKATLLFTTPYRERVVILRYPVGNKTTVEEVSDFFIQLASKFDDNSLIKVNRSK